jgi:hypothetical protein
MKQHIFYQFSTLLFSSILLAFSSSAYAADWSWVDDEIATSNFGQAAGFHILSVDVVPGEEYVVTTDDGDIVCRDYEITVEKERDLNPAGKGKYQLVVETEIETFCQPLEPLDPI